jgi:hypothetical protein
LPPSHMNIILTIKRTTLILHTILMTTNININTVDCIMEINANTRITYKGREGKRSDTEDSR